MKRFRFWLSLVVVTLVFTSLKPFIAEAADLVNDSFADGNSTVQNLANNSIRIFKGRSTTTRADAVGSVTFDMTATGSNSEAFRGFFTNSGTPVVYKQDGTLIDTIDLSVGTQSRLNGTVSFNYCPIIVNGNRGAIYLHQKLAYNQNYYVTMEPGVLADSSGAPFVGFSDSSVWNFSTKASAPIAGTAALTVAADGTGDFATVQGAIDFVPAGNGKRVVITVKKGTYTEIVYVGSNKPFVTVRGEDRDSSVVQYANNNSFNPTSTTHRAMFGVDAADFTLENITLRNTTPQGGSQAEAFRGNNNRIVLNRVNLYSYQDTLLLQGQSNQGGFVTDSYIEGDVDFMWGAGAVFFQNSEFKQLRTDAYYTQIRNGAGRNGYVYVNCKFTRNAGVGTSYLSRIDPDDFPYSQVVIINSQMDGIRPDPWRIDNPSLAATAANYPNIRFWEYNSRDLNGNPVDVSGRGALARQLTAAEAAQWSDLSFVLGGWTPQTKQTAAVSLSNLTQSYTGAPAAVSITTFPANLSISVTYNGSATPPAAIGTYSVVATVQDGTYQGTATGTLVIERAQVSITLSKLTHVYDGTPKEALVKTIPAGAPVIVTYNSSLTAPTEPGKYSVVAAVNDPNYIGGASATMTVYAPGQQPVKAFPGAEGAGELARGGRGGDVYHVTNVNDSGVGSLREAIRTANNPRTIVFDVSGTIKLQSRLNINKSFLTIAGQTAPGDGITVSGHITVVSGNNVIIRYLRFRVGDTNCPAVQDDALWIDKTSDVILDHISSSWSIDETLSVTESDRVTVQWSLITESLKNSCHEKGAHGYGSLIRFGNGVVTYHHNLYAHHDSRNPRLGDDVGLDFVNNVVYNWGGESGYSGDDPAEGSPRLNYVGNYLVAGPWTTASKRRAFNGGSANTQIYQSNNLIDGDLEGARDGVNNNWSMFTGSYTKREAARFEFSQIETDDAATAYARVLESAGSSLKRDSVDERVISEVNNEGGRHINSQNDVGGFPTLNSLAPQSDTDGDGMSDEWEYTHGLNPADAADGRLITGSGYSNLEIYLNKLTPVEFNYAPSASNDFARTDEDNAVAIDVLANDTDIDGDNLSLTSAAQGVNGTVRLVGNQALYTPKPDFYGADSFNYTVSDNRGNTTTGTVEVAINPINDSPVLTDVPATLSGDESEPFTFTAAAADIDSGQLTFSLVDAPSGATIDAASGQFAWTPGESRGGTGAPFVFRVRVSDEAIQAEAEISITVAEVNQAPTLNAIGNKTVPLGSTLSFNAVGADADLPAQTLAYSLTGTVPHGAAIDSNTGAFAWNPSISQVGAIYSFNVRVSDGTLSAEQPVTIGVAYDWSNLLAPINAGGGAEFKQGSIIPLKFKLIGASAGISNAAARLTLAKIVNGVAQTEFPATARGNSNAGNLFRFDAAENQYIFNLSTRNLTVGVYRLQIDLGDGVSRTALFTLN
ncbi:MAG TPA: pectinesterase family protein [Pyrinomonadaceae bacterium]|jgi:pectin methylesterase-like acyl-CoA thioesterase/pectate lyase